MKEILRFVFIGLTPPDPALDPDDPAEVRREKLETRRWQRSVALVLLPLLLLVGLHILWACGWIPGQQGFALASDVRDQRIDFLEYRLFSVRVAQCDAAKGGNAQAARFYSEKMRDLMRKFQEVTGGEYRPPDCGEI